MAYLNEPKTFAAMAQYAHVLNSKKELGPTNLYTKKPLKIALTTTDGKEHLDFVTFFLINQINSLESRYPNSGLAGGFLQNGNEEKMGWDTVKTFTKKITKVIQHHPYFRDYASLGDRVPILNANIFMRYEENTMSLPNYHESDICFVLNWIKNDILIDLYSRDQKRLQGKWSN